MVDKKVVEFLKDNERYKIFSYDEYRKSPIDLRILKIKLLNEYYKLILLNQSVDKLSVYIDFDGVILDTIGLSRKLLLDLYGIDYYKHSRSNTSQDKIVSEFFSSVDWYYLLDNSDEIACANKFLSLFKDSMIFKPTIYSAVSSDIEEKIKHDKFFVNYPGISSKFSFAGSPKECHDRQSVLIDDLDYNLINWLGKPVHFDSGGKKSMFFDIYDLGELYYLFIYNEKQRAVCNIPGLYDNYTQVYDEDTKRLVWKKR